MFTRLVTRNIKNIGVRKYSGNSNDDRILSKLRSIDLTVFFISLNVCFININMAYHLIKK